MAAYRRLTVARLVPIASAILVVGCGGVSQGPLAFPSYAGESFVGGGVRPGQFFVTSIPLENHGKRTAILVGIRPADGREARGLSLRYAASRAGGAHIGSDRGWKPAEWDLRRFEGFEVRAGETAAAVIGARARRPGIYFVRAFVVDYKVGGSDYRAVYHVGLEPCVGKSLSCPDRSSG